MGLKAEFQDNRTPFCDVKPGTPFWNDGVLYFKVRSVYVTANGRRCEAICLASGDAYFFESYVRVTVLAPGETLTVS